MKQRIRRMAVLAMLLCLQAVARGFIDPTFTPIDLVEQSGAILLLEFAEADDDGTAVATVKEVLKGEYEGEAVRVEFLAMGEVLAASGRAVMEWIAAGERQAMLFIGSFERDGVAPGDRLGYLHLAGRWVVLNEFEGSWDMESTSPRLLGCWAGSTDMLLTCVRYVMSDESAEVPVRANAVWEPEIKFASLQGAIHGVEPVNVSGTKGKADLFVMCAEGDRLYRFDGAGMADITSQCELTSRSQVCAWAELTGDDRLDLLSWDGAALSLHAQKSDGTFEETALRGSSKALTDGCLSLSPLDAEGGTKVVAGTRGRAVVLAVLADDGSIAAKPLARPDSAGADLGLPGPCLVADLDGDDKVDVLQLFSEGSLFHRGLGGADFAAPTLCEAATGKERHGVCMGDYDANGLLDVFVAGERRHRLFHNLGDGRFVDLLHQSGEVEYISKPGAIRAQTGDVNNDGRQDLLIVYGAQMPPQLFFNRGFRSFGHARELDLQVQELLPDASGGQQGGCLGDFNGDGALDMALALANLDLWILYREVESGVAMAATVALSPGGPYAGPINVAAWAGNPPRTLGIQVVRAGEAPALWGVPESEAGNVTIEWRTPDGAVKTNIVEVVPGDGPKHLLLGQPDDE